MLTYIIELTSEQKNFLIDQLESAITRSFLYGSDNTHTRKLMELKREIQSQTQLYPDTGIPQHMADEAERRFTWGSER